MMVGVGRAEEANVVFRSFVVNFSNVFARCTYGVVDLYRVKYAIESAG